jgi:hypothetical protein
MEKFLKNDMLSYKTWKTTHASCIGHFHAFQTINTVNTILTSIKNLSYTEEYAGLRRTNRTGNVTNEEPFQPEISGCIIKEKDRKMSLSKPFHLSHLG